MSLIKSASDQSVLKANHPSNLSGQGTQGSEWLNSTPTDFQASVD